MIKYYRVRSRMRCNCISGKINFPYGTILTCRTVPIDDLDNTSSYLYHNENLICSEFCEICHTFLVLEDQQGENRARLITEIFQLLHCDNARYIFDQSKLTPIQKQRWCILQSDEYSSKFRIPSLDDRWIWNHDFYTASIEDLQYVKTLLVEVQA